MMMRLDPPIPLDCPKGFGWAHVLIDYGQEHQLIFVVFIDATRECWAVPNSEVRIVNNWTMQRRSPAPKGEDHE
jgi:hypothetical protein